MKTSKDIAIEKKQDALWHYKNCTIERQDDPESGTEAWCDEHKVDVTECLPGYDYDPYDNYQENDLLEAQHGL